MKENYEIDTTQKIIEKVKIVAVLEEDWEDLKDIRLASLLESSAAFGIQHKDAINYTAEEWKQKASLKHGPRFFIAYMNEAPAGLIGGVFSNNEYELISMWVAPESRGSGVGKLLVDALKENVMGGGHRSIMLKVSQENKAACSLYTRCGFKVVGNCGALASDENILLQKMEWSEDFKP